jgi:hypothetical protein
MSAEHSHVRDEDLLLHASGELRSDSDAHITRHLERCCYCRERLDGLQNSLSGFGEAHRNLRQAELPPADRARSSLQSHLAEFAIKHEQNGWRFFRSPSFACGRSAALAAFALAAYLVLALWLRHPAEMHPGVLAAHREEPDLRLTPGATIPVTESDICGTASETAPSIPIALQQKVFELYKVTQPPDQFEVDYLITPELGGATDIRNLWPEPYHDAVWNAHVKDQLEDRLHRMVCHGQVDLRTAQRDISTDWIAAYRKYFHTDRPIADGSSRNFSWRRKRFPST